MTARHDIRIRVADQELTNWLRYEIESDLMQPADAFTIELSNVAGAMAGAVAPFQAVQVIVDGVLQMTGFVDRVEYEATADGANVSITGRDRFGQLVDISAEPRTYNGITLLQLATTLSGSHVTEWIIDNEENRAAMQKAKSTIASLKKARETLNPIPYQIIDGPSRFTDASLSGRIERMQAHLALVRKRVYHKVKIEPGETAFDVLQRCAERSGLMLWCAANGSGVIARPNYSQNVSGRIRFYPQTSPNADRGNVTSARVSLSGTDRYSEYRALATAGNTRTNYARASRYDHTERDADVSIERKYIFTAEAQRQGEIADAALREYQRRKFMGTELTYTVRGHSQDDKLWQADTLVHVDDQVNGVSGTYYITARRFEGGPQGQLTSLTCRPKDLLLA